MKGDFLERILFILREYGLSMLGGAGTTLLIAIVGTFFGCVIGFVVGVIQTIPVEPRDSKVKKVLLKIVRAILRIYVEVFRGTPMMAQAMFIKYGMLLLFGVDMSMWFAAFFIVSINTGAYMAETVRGGVMSIPLGQTEGAKAIGMNHIKTMTYVVMPQCLRNILPQIGNNLIINIKDTCVLSCIGTVELFFVSKSVSGAYYKYFEVYTITMVMYLCMTLFFSFLLRRIEKKMDGPKAYKLVATGAPGYDVGTKDTLAYTSGNLIVPDSVQVDDRKLSDPHE
ncbi:MAG: amino acid ABC transporter permease [Parasporobacterium sp.]|nr:amino acid ABC transporter permease [Parasporobacterium sp.]